MSKLSGISEMLNTAEGGFQYMTISKKDEKQKHNDKYLYMQSKNKENVSSVKLC